VPPLIPRGSIATLEATRSETFSIKSVAWRHDGIVAVHPNDAPKFQKPRFRVPDYPAT